MGCRGKTKKENRVTLRHLTRKKNLSGAICSEIQNMREGLMEWAGRQRGFEVSFEVS